MSKIDSQLKSNDCGISVVKTIFNLFNISIDRKYIENKIPLEEKGSRLSDIRFFFNTNGFEANYKLLDINYVQGNVQSLQELFPFILSVQNNNELHYVVVTDLKNDKLKILDPSEGSEYYLSIQELKKKSHYNKTSWNFADTDEKIIAICSQELDKFDLNIYNVLENTDSSTLFNKLTYFSYLKENFGFKNFDVEKDFLLDLINNQEIGILPKHFRTLKYNNDKVKITAPLILTIKQKEQKQEINFPKDEKQSLYWKLFKQLGQYKQLWYIYIFAALFSASTTQIAVFTNQILIDEILPSYNLGILIMFSVGLLIYKLFDLGTSIYKSFVAIHLGNILDKYFLNTFDSKINSFSLPYIHSYKKGDLVERISDAIKLKTFFLRFFTNVLIDVFVSIYSLAILFYINWKLTFIVVGVMILFYAWFRFITPMLKQNERLRYIKKAEFLSKMIEKIEGIQVIKSFRIEYFHSSKISKSINDFLKIQLRNGYIDLINKVVVAFIIIISSIIIMYYITTDAIVNQLITLGQIVTFISLSGRIFSSLKGILDENLTLQENEVILKRFLDFEEENNVNIKNKGIRDFTIEKFEILNLSFGYITNDPILKEIDLKINKGNKIKIEGNNGSGKSTLSKILTALYEPTSGQIIINGNNKNFFDYEQLKEKILLVSNEDILFNDTIFENICLGKDIPIKRILDFAKEIDFYDFIASKDEGLDYIINENGKNLSTGQRKKILLLRAFFSNSEMIILDEVLSGMDSESREKVEKLIDDIDNTTFIIISHEPITNINFDFKYKITNGELFPI